jgi:hypothetical protein
MMSCVKRVESIVYPGYPVILKIKRPRIFEVKIPHN